MIFDNAYRLYTISDDGNALYLLQPSFEQGQSSWQLFVYDMQTSQMSSQPLVDQDNRPVALRQRTVAVPSPDGRWIYSLETDASGTQIIYAIDLATRSVRRIDLPLAGGIGVVAQVPAWLVVSKDGSTLYVINSTPASIVRIATGSYNIERSQRLLLLGPLVVPGRLRPSGGRAANGIGNGYAGIRRAAAVQAPLLSLDGRALYLATSSGIAVVNLADLSLSATLLPAVPVDSMVLSSDGVRLFVVSSQLGQIIEVNARTGTILARLNGVGQGWALLHVTTSR